MTADVDLIKPEVAGDEVKRVSVLRKLILIFAEPVIVVACLLVIFCVWSFVMYGNLNSGLAVMNGFLVFVDEAVLDLGDIPVGETRTGKFKINNASSKPVVILGAWTDCSCLVTDELPMTIPSRSKVDFDVKLQTDSSMTGRHIVREVILNLDVDQPAIGLKIKFSVTGTNSTTGGQ
jgi:hypothetical protein